mmetsp:Transcript_65501/g.152079  ORF Transcript_65501/g.152079 Transcript_65501/m.152079 type:complete len:162 (-) Transcript_65501:93-578(-)
MKPAWDKLARKYRNSSTLLIADVDCTSAGKKLCEEVGVKGYPTIKYGDPDDLQDYKGSRSFDELEKFAASLGQMCSPARAEFCDEKEKSKMDEYIAMGAEKRQKAIDEMEAKMKRVESEYKRTIDRINDDYRRELAAKDDAIKAVRDSGLGHLKALRALEA